jgi:hypothetical protein
LKNSVGSVTEADPLTSLDRVEAGAMMGRQETGQAPLFYSFNLEEHVPANHLLGGIDQCSWI